MSALDLQSDPLALLLVAAVCWAGLYVQKRRAVVRDRRAARSALARVLPESRQHPGADDGELQEQTERNQDDRDRYRQHKGKLKVLEDWHPATLPTPPGAAARPTPGDGRGCRRGRP